jgi:hypothetical protein
MIKDKYNFILKLLQIQKLNTEQRERILILVAKELKNDSYYGFDLNARLERIELELELFKKNNPIKNENEDNQDTTNHKKGTNNSRNNKTLANPKHVADFMSLFNKRDGLKYLTHDFDENDNFDIDSFLIKAKNIFDEKTKQLSIPKSLWRIVEQFAFSEEPNWTALSENYEKKSMSSSWKKWAINQKDSLHPWRNERYKTIINDFRRLTRIESSPGKNMPNLETLFDKCIQFSLKDLSKDFEIEKMDLSKADFYTNVDNLKNALITIFDEIKKRADLKLKKKITIKYEREHSEEYFLRKIIITHQNSFPLKELQILLKEWPQKGNMGRIYEKLNGYCHWSVETKIEDKFYKINILKENNTPFYEEIEGAKGFSHILTFYYK